MWVSQYHGRDEFDCDACEIAGAVSCLRLLGLLAVASLLSLLVVVKSVQVVQLSERRAVLCACGLVQHADNCCVSFSETGVY